MKDELKRAVHRRGRTTEDSTKKTKTVERRSAKRSVNRDALEMFAEILPEMEPWQEPACTSCKGSFKDECMHVLRLGTVGHVWCTECIEAWKKRYGITGELRPGNTYSVVGPLGRSVRAVIA